MKAKLKRAAIALAILIPAVVALVETERFLKRRAPECASGQCKPSSGHGLIINPFPDEISPKTSGTNQPNKELKSE